MAAYDNPMKVVVQRTRHIILSIAEAEGRRDELRRIIQAWIQLREDSLASR